MADPFIGEIRPFAFAFPPWGWASCDGQQMPIAQNTALFSILGTTYGGNGVSTFNLPNLQGQVPMGAGAGPGLTPRELGSTEGASSVTLSASNFPAHTHSVQCNSGNATVGTASGNFLAKSVKGSASRPASVLSYDMAIPPLASLAADTVSVAGSSTLSQTRANQQPYLPIQLGIALYGEFPSRP